MADPEFTGKVLRWWAEYFPERGSINISAIHALSEIFAPLDELDRVEKERDEAKADAARLRENHKGVVKAKKVAGEYRDQFKARAEAAEGLIEQAVRALTGAIVVADVKPWPAGMSPEARAGLQERYAFATSTLASLLKASRPQNREETDAENERIS